MAQDKYEDLCDQIVERNSALAAIVIVFLPDGQATYAAKALSKEAYRAMPATLHAMAADIAGRVEADIAAKGDPS